MKRSRLLERVASTVCTKPTDLTHEECYESIENPLCREHGRCRIHEKTAEQLNYVLSPTQENIFLKACPGSGKTEVVGLKAAYEIQRWTAPIGGLAVLTFTNNAAHVISSRVNQFVGNRGLTFPHFVGTLDSWLHGFIANPFAHHLTGYEGKAGDRSIRVIDEQSTHPFLGSFKTRYSYGTHRNVFAHQFCVDDDAGHVFVRQAKSAEYVTISPEEWGIADFRETKKRFLKSGFATYRDIETVCLQLLDDDAFELAEILKSRFPIIIIDECQDLSPVQLDIVERLIEAGTAVHLVGDLNQAIYGFRKTFPQKVNEFVAKHEFSTKKLTRNFRSVQSIVNLCGQLVDQGVVGGCEKCESGPACICLEYAVETLAEMAGRFVEHLAKRNIPVEEAAILSRGRAKVARLRPGESGKLGMTQRLPAAIKLWQAGHIPAMDDALKCMGAFVANKFFSKRSVNSRHYDCPEDITTPLRWRLFLAKLLDACTKHKEIADLNCSWSGWARIARSCFRSLLLSCVDGLQNLSREDEETLPDLDGRTYRIPKGMGDASVDDTLAIMMPATSQRVRITTFHQVKGETFDAVLVVSALNRGKGGHWKEWIKDPASENARFAYVASSRPRNLLAWAVPQLESKDRAKLEELGFAFIGGDYLDE